MTRILRRRVVVLAAALTPILLAAPRAGAVPQSATRAPAPEAVSTADRLYQSATGLLNRGLHELAADEFRRFLKAAPEHAKASEARYGLAICLQRLGQLDAAERELTLLAAMRDHPFAFEVLALLGQCQLARGDAKAALETFQRALRAHAQHELASDLAALTVEAAAGAAEAELCIRLADEFSRRWPDAPQREWVLWFAAGAAAARGEWNAARAQLEALLAKFPDGALAPSAGLLRAQCLERSDPAAACDAYRELLKSRDAPVALEARLGLVRAQFAAGDATSAAGNAERGLRENLSAAQRESLLMLAGRARLEMKQYSRAVEHFQAADALDQATRRDECAFWLARCAARQGEPARAMERLSTALRAYPESSWRAELTYELASSASAAGQFEPAVLAFQEFLRAFPKHAMAPDAQAGLASVLHRLKRYEESARCCAVFLEQFPQHALAADVRLMAGEDEFLRGDFAAALRQYQSLLLAEPDASQAGTARVRAGVALSRLGRLDEAIQSLQDSIEIAEREPALRTALLTLADLQIARADWPAAIAALDRYLRAVPDAPAAAEALLSLGLAQRRNGDAEAAAAAFDRAAKQSRDDATRRQAEFERAQTLLVLERDAEAESALKTLAETPSLDAKLSAAVAQHLARLALRRGAASDAVRWARRAVEADSDASAAAGQSLLLGQALFAAGELSDAVDSLDASLRGGLSDSDRTTALTLRAQALARQGRAAEALTALDGLAGMKLDPAARCTLLYERALCLKALKRGSEARAPLTSLLQSCADSAEQPFAALELAELEAGEGQTEPAAKLLRELIARGGVEKGDSKVVPADVLARASYRLGLIEFEAAHYPAAARLLEAFLASDRVGEAGPSAAFYCGEAQRLAGKHEAAVRWFERVLEAYADSDSAPSAQLRLGEALAALQRWDDSARVFAAFLKKRPDHEQWYQAQFALGWARENAGEYDQAMLAYQRVIERHQGVTAARAQFQIGECLFAQKRYDDAVRELLRVEILYAYPEWSAAALFEAGRCFEALGQLVEARRQFERVRKEFSDSAWAKSAAQRLAALGRTAPPGRERRETP